jgi:hypothetical protein
VNTERSPLESNSRSASQEILHVFCNKNVHYRVHKSSPLDPILNQLNSVHTLQFFKIHFNIIFLFAPKFPKCYLSSMFFD